MPQNSRTSRKAGKSRSTADRLVTIVVIIFLVLVVGGAVTLQLTANPGSAPTPPARPESSATTPPTQATQRMAVAQAKQLVDAGQAVLVDTRLAETYQSDHAVGAISFPEGNEAASFSQLPADKILIFYCT